MDRKQHPEMWFVFLVSFSLCITAQTECSVEWLGLKIKVYTKMLEGIWDWWCEHTLCPAPGTFSWWLRPAEGPVRTAAEPEHTRDAESLSHPVPDAQRAAEEDGEHHMDWPGGGQGAPQREGGRDAGDGRVLALLGWFTQPRLVSDMHMHSLYTSRTVISNSETNKANVQIKIFFLLLEH